MRGGASEDSLGRSGHSGSPSRGVGGASNARAASNFRSPAGSFIFMRQRGRGQARPRRPAPVLGSRPGGGSGPSGAPPASALGREFPLGHDSKMCRGRSCPGVGGVSTLDRQEGRIQGRDGSSLLGQVQRHTGPTLGLLQVGACKLSFFFFSFLFRGYGFRTQYLVHDRPALYH